VLKSMVKGILSVKKVRDHFEKKDYREKKDFRP